MFSGFHSDECSNKFNKFFNTVFVIDLQPILIFKMKFKIIPILLLFMLSCFLKASGQYHIKINIDGYTDTVLLLTTYYGNKVLLVDTAYATEPGDFILSGDSSLAGGIYMAVSGKKKKLFEFIVDKEQEFEMRTDTVNYSLKMQISGSEENDLFFNYIRFNEQQHQNNKQIREMLHNTSPDSPEYLIIQRQMDSINKITVDYKLNLISSYPDLFISKMLGAMREVEIPDSVKTSTDSTATYKYYKKHYWDYFDLSDKRLLHTPLTDNKVDQYFEQLVVVHPDSIIAEIDRIIALARPSNEMVSWLVWKFVSEYQNPKYMGFDVVFIHLADEYFQKEPIRNTTPSILKTIVDQANKMRPLVLGSPAPNLILIDTSGQYRSFHNLTNDYILLFFWDFDCGICKIEIQGLKELVIDKQFDIGVFAININAELDKWKSSIIEQNFTWTNVNGTRSVTADYHDLYDTHGTPALFILDKDRNIIAKQIATGQINQFLKNHEKRINKLN